MTGLSRWPALVVLAALAMIGAPRSWAGWDEALTLYQAGDYIAAEAQFRALAEQDDARAQYNLGVLYERGLGVTKNYGEAVKWYSLAAQKGLAAAQYNLGLMYLDGRGLPQDDLSAYVWFGLAAKQGLEEARRALTHVRARLSPEMALEAERLSADWMALSE